MINGKTVLAIIPARGGSKGLPGKNIKDLCGKPLIGWTIEKAKKSRYLDEVVVTTDCEKIDAHRIISIDEKPIHRFFVNAGIYVLEPEGVEFDFLKHLL